MGLAGFAAVMAQEAPLRSYAFYAMYSFLAMWGFGAAAFAWRFYATAKPIDPAREPVFFMRRHVAALAPAVALIVQWYVEMRLLDAPRRGPPLSGPQIWQFLPLAAVPSLLESVRMAAGRPGGRNRSAVTIIGLVYVAIALLIGLSLMTTAMRNMEG